MNGSIRIATIRGIPVSISASWIIVFVLFLWSFAASYYPDRFPGWTTQAYVAAGLTTTLFFFASIVVHELGHALIAARFGIRTRRITLVPIGGLAEIEREPQKPAQELAIGIAGPATSLLLGGLFLGLYVIVHRSSMPLGGITAYLGWVNIALAVFNLVPGYPMDGGRVLRAIVWGLTKSYSRGTRVAAGVGSLVAYGFIAIGVVLAFNGQIANGIILAFVGWFVLTSAQGNVQQLTLQQELKGITVDHVMTRDFAVVQAGATLAQVINETFLAYNTSAGAVEQRGRFVGIVTLSDVVRIPQDQWEGARVEAVMIPLARLIAVAPTDQVLAALERIQEGSFNQLPVVVDGHIVGLLTRNDLLRFVQLRAALHLPPTTGDDSKPPQEIESENVPLPI
jgi:Zn-dependent protease/CBS domain-containing protein